MALALSVGSVTLSEGNTAAPGSSTAVPLSKAPLTPKPGTPTTTSARPSPFTSPAPATEKPVSASPASLRKANRCGPKKAPGSTLCVIAPDAVAATSQFARPRTSEANPESPKSGPSAKGAPTTNSPNRSPSMSPAQATDVPTPTVDVALAAGVKRTIATGTLGLGGVTGLGRTTALGKSDMFGSLSGERHTKNTK